MLVKKLSKRKLLAMLVQQVIQLDLMFIMNLELEENIRIHLKLNSKKGKNLMQKMLKKCMKNTPLTRVFTHG